ncbi:MAG TPA: pilus (MSHA type) biogenesis protein MshL [Rhodocyclaceae bacterium]
MTASHRLPSRILLACLIGLGACSSTFRHGDDTLTRIGDEMKAPPAPATSEQRVAAQLLPPLEVPLPKMADAIEPRFDLAVNNAPAAEVFLAIASGTRYSMLLPNDLSGSVTLSLKDVTVHEALDAMRELYGYQYRVSGTRVYVQPNTLQSRVFQVNYLSGRRQGMSELRVTSSSISSSQNPGSPISGSASASSTPAQPATGSGSRGSSESSRVVTSSDSDFWAELRISLEALVGNADGRSVVINPMSGIVVVRGMPDDLRNVERYLAATQLTVERQVMLEAKIIEVVLNDSFQSGINWAALGGANRRYAIGVSGANATLDTSGVFGTNSVGVLPGAGGALTTSAGGTGFYGLALQSNNFAGLLNFLETQGSVQVLSSPRIATLNNQKAVLKVGADEFFVTNVTTTTSSTTSGSTTSPTITLQPFFSGIALDVTPQIDDQNNIILHVHPAISVVAEKQKQIDLGSLGLFNLPLAASAINETDSIVRVQDGTVVAIGGLMKQEQTDSRSQVPGAGDVPGLGALFGQRAKAFRKSELVVLIKPTIIQGEQSWARDLLDTRERLQKYGVPADSSR